MPFAQRDIHDSLGTVLKYFVSCLDVPKASLSDSTYSEVPKSGVYDAGMKEVISNVSYLVLH